MARLKDCYLEDVPQGSLVFPSSSARESGNGGYLLELEGVSSSKRHIKNDSEIFPAVMINPRTGTLVTPTGLKNLSRHSLVAVVK